MKKLDEILQKLKYPMELDGLKIPEAKSLIFKEFKEGMEKLPEYEMPYDENCYVKYADCLKMMEEFCK